MQGLSICCMSSIMHNVREETDLIGCLSGVSTRCALSSETTRCVGTKPTARPDALFGPAGESGRGPSCVCRSARACRATGRSHEEGASSRRRTADRRGTGEPRAPVRSARTRRSPSHPRLRREAAGPECRRASLAPIRTGSRFRLNERSGAPGAGGPAITTRDRRHRGRSARAANVCTNGACGQAAPNS